VAVVSLETYLLQYLTLAPGNGSQRMAHCPQGARHSNFDKDASCSVNLIEGLLFCHVCGLSGNIYEVAETLGWPPPPNGDREPQSGLPTAWYERPIKAFYHYEDRTESTVYTVCRVEYFKGQEPKKEFPLWCQGGWRLKKGVDKIPYRLPQLIEDQDVFLVEGEKDVGTIEKMGLTATTFVGGAGKWRNSYAEHFIGKSVVILPDNDAPGRAHAQAVAQGLRDVAVSVKVFELPGLPETGDVSDMVEGFEGPAAAGEELSRLAERAELWQLPRPGTRHRQRSSSKSRT